MKRASFTFLFYACLLWLREKLKKKLWSLSNSFCLCRGNWESIKLNDHSTGFQTHVSVPWVQIVWNINYSLIHCHNHNQGNSIIISGFMKKVEYNALRHLNPSKNYVVTFSLQLITITHPALFSNYNWTHPLLNKVNPD